MNITIVWQLVAIASALLGIANLIWMWLAQMRQPGEKAIGDRRRLTVPADDIVEAGRIDWAIPASTEPGPYRVAMSVRSADGELLNENHTDVTVR